MPFPLRGPVPTKIKRRTKLGSATVSACATRPPSEKPRTSTFVRPSALMNAAALAAISSTEVGTSPLVLENARVVEQDHLPRLRKAVGDERVPVIHRPGEVLVENERHAVRLAEATIGVGLDELRRRGLVGMNHYGRALITQSAPHLVRALGLLSRNRRRSALWAPR
jgi:hypothetical protein